MKRLVLISLAILLTASEGFCQSPPFLRNDAESSINGADLTVGSAGVDSAGKIVTGLTLPGQSWQACSAAATNTSDTAIKAAVALNRIYTTQINCHNNSAVASIITLKDGATGIYSSWLSANTLAQNVLSISFPVPLRGTVNTALNFAMTTTSTSTICCASGYISVN